MGLEPPASHLESRTTEGAEVAASGEEMSRKRWVEVVCDACGCADHFPLGNVSQQMKNSGWLVSVLGDFCDKECKKKFMERITKCQKKQ